MPREAIPLASSLFRGNSLDTAIQTHFLIYGLWYYHQIPWIYVEFAIPVQGDRGQTAKPIVKACCTPLPMRPFPLIEFPLIFHLSWHIKRIILAQTSPGTDRAIIFYDRLACVLAKYLIPQFKKLVRNAVPLIYFFLIAKCHIQDLRYCSEFSAVNFQIWDPPIRH